MSKRISQYVVLTQHVMSSGMVGWQYLMTFWANIPKIFTTWWHVLGGQVIWGGGGSDTTRPTCPTKEKDSVYEPSPQILANFVFAQELWVLVACFWLGSVQLVNFFQNFELKLRKIHKDKNTSQLHLFFLAKTVALQIRDMQIFHSNNGEKKAYCS